MADSDEYVSDEELNQAAKDGTIREGTGRIHHKLFQKYGFLIPEKPMHHGETIFFGLTAHVDASRKYIADLRDELKPDQRIKYMAVPVERDGQIKWKALVVAPLPSDQQFASQASGSSEDSEEWLTCKILPNLQPLRGFATPEGCDQYHDNVYFSTREASNGLGEQVSDLTAVFKPGETVKALVVPADPHFKAKYRAIKICKAPNITKPSSPVANQILVEEMDQGAVAWIYSVLKMKNSVKITTLAGNLSHYPEFRSVMQPQKKSVRKFLAKFPRYFNIREDSVFLDPECPPLLHLSKGGASQSGISNESSRSLENWSDSEVSSPSPEFLSRSSSITPTSHDLLRSVPDLSSKFTISMMAHIVKSQAEPMKMNDIFKLCQQKGWETMISVAMVAQVITNNATYFIQDEKGYVHLTAEGQKLSLKQADKEQDSTILQPKAQVGNSTLQAASPALPSVLPLRSDDDTKLNQTSTSFLGGYSAFTPFSASGARDTGSAFSPPNSAYSQYGFPSLSNNVSSMFSQSLFQVPNSTLMNGQKSNEAKLNHIFPSSILSPPVNNNVYQSDTEDSFEDKNRMANTPTSSTSHYTETEGRFLSLVARGICPNAVGANEEVFRMLKKELDAMGITQGDADGYVQSGLLSRHLVCIQMDKGRPPRAKFQHFTPSGKITQTTVNLHAEKTTQNALATMLNTVSTNIKKYGKTLYGIADTFHFIRVLSNETDEMRGCTICYREQESSGIRPSDFTEFGSKKKVKIIFTGGGGKTSKDACAYMRKLAVERSAKSAVVAIDMEGQIFGFQKKVAEVRRIICSSLDSQQHHLKEALHHEPNLVVANAIDCESSLELVQRIASREISVYAEVPQSLEKNVERIFEVTN